jgi:hypothetical protein
VLVSDHRFAPEQRGRIFDHLRDTSIAVELLKCTLFQTEESIDAICIID